MADYKVKAEGLNEALSTFFAVTPPHMKPIEMEEALPQPEDLDDSGCCWWFYLDVYGNPCWVLSSPFLVDGDLCRHWLAAKHIANPIAE